MTLSRLFAAPILLLTAMGAFAHETDDYPTHEVVEYVFDCMQQYGGQNYDNLYKCSCSIDYIASKMTHGEFIAADTFIRGQNAAGERAEILREGDIAESQRADFEDIEAQAAHACFLPAQAEAEGGEAEGDDD
jgi:hypothetical protein